MSEIESNVMTKSEINTKIRTTVRMILTKGRYDEELINEVDNVLTSLKQTNEVSDISCFEFAANLVVSGRSIYNPYFKFNYKRRKKLYVDLLNILSNNLDSAIEIYDKAPEMFERGAERICAVIVNRCKAQNLQSGAAWAFYCVYLLLNTILHNILTDTPNEAIIARLMKRKHDRRIAFAKARSVPKLCSVQMCDTNCNITITVK